MNKETIFFNKDQVKLIASYSILYKTYFRYGIYIAGFLLSLVIFFIISNISFISAFSLNNVVDMNGRIASIEQQYQNNFSVVKLIENVKLFLSDGQVSANNWILFSEDNVLVFWEGLVLPRLLHIAEKNLQEHYNTSFLAEKYEPKKMEAFFKEVLVYPVIYAPFRTPLIKGKIQLKETIKSDFSLECLDQSSRTSPICRNYINNFLATFPYYTLENAYSEFRSIASNLSQNTIYHQKICNWINKMLDLWAEVDVRLKNMIYDCSNVDRQKYLLRNDFEDIQRGLMIGYISSSVYSTPELNYYKLLSAQQLLAKQINNWESIASLLVSYLNFVKELWAYNTKFKDGEWVPFFYKQFIYWFNNEVIIPVLNNETFKITKDQKNSLLNDLLLINNGSKALGFNSLQSIVLKWEIWVQESKPISSSQEASSSDSLDLELLFKDSYLPAQFSLLSTDTLEDGALLKIRGIDRKTDLELQAFLRFARNTLYVERIEISWNSSLENYVNAILKNNQFIFTRTLGIIEENQEIGSQSQQTASLCDAFVAKYRNDVVSCGLEKLIMKKNQGPTYTFSLLNEELIALSISDKELEKAILATLDFKAINKSNTRPMITAIYNYQLEDEDSGFGMRTSLQVLDYFKKFLNIEPENIVHDHGVTRVYFVVKDIKFIARYDIVSNNLSQIWFDVGIRKDGVVIKNFSLLLSSANSEAINSFLFDPLEAIGKVNPNVVKKYFGTWKNLLPSDQW